MQGQYTKSAAMTASQAEVNPISTWAGRFPPYRALVSILVNATTAGVVIVVSAGSRAIAPRQAVQGGGTAGVLPNPLSTTPIQFIAEAGEEIMPLLTEVLGGTPTYNIIVSWEAV